MRIAFLPLVLALCLGLPAAAGRASEKDFPTQGPELRKIDWKAFFPEGDGWKKSKQVLVFNNDGEPKTLDPGLMTGNIEHTLAMAMFEGLTTLHPDTLQPLPGAAEWWEISPDGLTYTFHLRPGMKWSNGDAFTAEDFRWSWERALSPALASQYADILYAIDGSEAFNKGETKDFSKVGVRVVDPTTLVVRLRSPTPYFLELTSFETLMPVHRATVEKWGAEWTKPEHVVSNVPFVLAAWRPKDAVEMTPNPRWWNRPIVRLERVIVKCLDDVDTSLNEYKAGSVDWIRQVPALRVEEAQADPDYFVTPYMTTWFLRINVTKKPFDDVRVRKAFDLAINKKEICEKTLKAGQMPAMGAVPPGIHGYPELQGLAYDPKAARKLLAEAGYADGKGFPEVELLYNVNESHKVVSEAISSMWREVLGVRVRLQQREWQAYLEDQKNMNYQIARAGWIGDYADPNTFLDMWCKGRGNNETGWENEEYDSLLKAATLEQDPPKRLALLQKAERILCVDDLPIIPIYYYVNQGMLRPSVKNWYPNLRDLHPLQYVYIDGPSATDRSGR
jgi:oligopeptide transport system substrate-binding protein